MEYFTIEHSAQTEIVRSKSRFIASCAKCESEQQAVEFVESVKRQHPAARHNVYAYKIRQNNISRYTDDGEPSGTAGLPVLRILETSFLTDIALVVTRYFGGTLLGKGGLVSAYTDSSKAAVNAARIQRMLWCVRLSLNMDYKLHRAVLATAQRCGATVSDEQFGENVSLALLADAENEAQLTAALSEIAREQSIITDRQYGFYPAE